MTDWKEITKEFLQAPEGLDPLESQFCSDDLKKRIQRMAEEIARLREQRPTKDEIAEMGEEIARLQFNLRSAIDAKDGYRIGLAEVTRERDAAKYVMVIQTINFIDDDKGLDIAISHFRRADWTEKDIIQLKSGEPVEFEDLVVWAGNKLKTTAILKRIMQSV